VALIGLGLGIVGVAVLVAPSGADVHAIHPVGGVVLVLAALSWSFGSLLTRSLRLPSSPLMAVAIQMTAGGAMLILWGTVAGEWSALDLAGVSTRSILALVYLVTIGSIVALGAYVWLMQNVSATAVSTYAFVNPVVAVLLGWALAGETLDARTGTAAALIVCAVVILQGSRARLGPRRRARRTAEGEAAEAKRIEMPDRARCESA
jgi:drug/metabolite transporter (DMT)-like permease